MKKIIYSVAILMVIFIAGMLVQRFWFMPSKSGTQVISPLKKEKRKILYWRAPMNPSYRSTKPGKSPMGMDLVPVYVDEQTMSKGVVKISSVVENNLGVKSALVQRRDLSRLIKTVGHVVADENNIEHIHTYTDGWVKVLKVKTTGEVVHKGQLLLELYSPTLVNAQEEFLLAIKNKGALLIRAGRKKLLTLGMAQSQINRLQQERHVMQHVKIYATQSGIVSQLNIREGNFVKPDTDLMTIEDLSNIWMIAEVFERQANWVRVGQPASATLPYLPGKVWQGKVDYVYPQLDQKTHTLRVRLTFPNPDLAIKPNMYADIKIMSAMIKDALSIPHSALIRTGQGDRVILALGGGRYKAQVVTLGIEAENYYQILSGLKVGERVVTSAQFLIDSESNLKASFDRMTNRKSDSKNQTNTLPQQFIGTGEVKAVNQMQRTLSLYHQPISALNMPAMTMQFFVSKDIDLSKVKVGDEVHFVMVRQKEKQYLITKLHVMKPSSPRE